MNSYRFSFLLASLLAVGFSASPAFAAKADKVEKLKSGVVITHLSKTNGGYPKATSNVTVNYRGTLKDGTEFDSSYKRKAPISFELSRVIPCWTQGVQKMRIGEKAKLTCPGDTAYGSQGIPGVIPPNAELTFEVELLAVQ